MKMKKLILAVLVIALLVFSGAALIGASELPSAKDYEKDVPPAVLKRAGTLPDGYMFPNDWVKKQDWKAIREKHSGTKLTIMFEGTDIGAPLMTKDQFEKLTGMKLVFIGVPVQMQFEKLLISTALGPRHSMLRPCCLSKCRSSQDFWSPWTTGSKNGTTIGMIFSPVSRD
jgi:hypothetical protein